MIQTKEDYAFYLKADQLALGISHNRPRFYNNLQDEIWRFERLLRKVEYLENCGSNPLDKLLCLQAKYSFQKMSVKLGISVPRNVCGPGLSIAHGGPIIIHPKALIGENCRIDRSVSVGSVYYPAKPPKIGDNVFIGPGSVINGNITIADGIAIGANSYVNRSFEEPNITIAGCPAKKISNKGSKYCWFQATDILRKETGSALIDSAEVLHQYLRSMNEKPLESIM